MKLDLKVGMYIRYIPTIGEYTQKISKITNIKNCMLDMCYTLDNKEEVYSSHFDDIIKASDKLIDLVEYMDLLVIEKKVKDINNNEVYFFNPVRCDGFTTFENNQHCMIINMDYIIPIENIKIYQILTREQFEQMSYKVGD